MATVDDTQWYWDGAAMHAVEVIGNPAVLRPTVNVIDEDENIYDADRHDVYEDSAAAINALFELARMALASIELIQARWAQQGGDPQVLRDKVAEAKERFDKATTVEEVRVMAEELDDDTLYELTQLNEDEGGDNG
jgi:hypothetical protein